LKTSTHRKLVAQLWLFAAGSFAFGFLLVPLYGVLCDITGYGDRSRLVQAAAVAQSPDESRTVTVEFISTAPTFGAWEFRPAAGSMQVHPGRLYEATFEARNLREQPMTALAVPSVAPLQATRYFHKTECFCFTPQLFGASETRQLTVRFIVDRQLPLNIDRLTLGYAMYDSREALINPLAPTADAVLLAKSADDPLSSVGGGSDGA
jgi:cytochrome c oxidase assembly protein subunit 11